jgi:hypothetical protein
MKSTKLAKVIGVAALTAGIAIAPVSLPAAAQDTTTTPPDGIVVEEDGFDWGWLGLLGLIGLAGLSGKKNRSADNSVHRDPSRIETGVYREPHR